VSVRPDVDCVSRFAASRMCCHPAHARLQTKPEDDAHKPMPADISGNYSQHRRTLKTDHGCRSASALYHMPNTRLRAAVD
jgi:hypothetical protein